MKIVAVGDTHGRPIWKSIIEKEKPNIFVFIGDYFDSRDNISAAEQIHNFKEIMNIDSEYPETQIIRLLGNHDMYIDSAMEQHIVSGYQSGASSAIQAVLQEHKDKLQMCFRHGNLLFTHAGVGYQWLVDNDYDGVQPIDEFVNELWKYKPLTFKFNGMHPSGDDIYQTPIWIRPRSLVIGNKGLLDLDYIQIVGHTTQSSILRLEVVKDTPAYFFIDTLGISGEYLIIDKGKFEYGKVL